MFNLTYLNNTNININMPYEDYPIWFDYLSKTAKKWGVLFKVKVVDQENSVIRAVKENNDITFQGKFKTKELFTMLNWVMVDIEEIQDDIKGRSVQDNIKVALTNIVDYDSYLKQAEDDNMIELAQYRLYDSKLDYEFITDSLNSCNLIEKLDIITG